MAKAKPKAAKAENPSLGVAITDHGSAVKVRRSEENWSECELEDGTILRVKPIVMEVRKLHLPDVNGNPAYSVRSTLITDVQLPVKTK